MEKNLIYRGSYLVHWSPALGSVLSDIEVDRVQVPPGKMYLDVPSGRALVGLMYDVAYSVAGTGDTITVSTTRPETMIGDVAVAVHPDDSRYTDLLNRGVHVRHPLREDPIPLVADRLSVDPSMGTGALKITPSHDPVDFEVARRLSLPSIDIIDERGHITFPTDNKGHQLSPAGRALLVSLLSELSICAS